MKTTRTALLVLSLALGLSSAAHAQDGKAAKGKQSEKAPKKDAAKADGDVTYLDMSSPDAPESDLPAIVKKGSL